MVAEDAGASPAFTFGELQWDTDFFGIPCAKAVLCRPLTITQWLGLKARFRPYRFVSIENRNSEPVNAQLIGAGSSAFLADVNIQFVKKTSPSKEGPDQVRILDTMGPDESILSMAEFRYSKFLADPGLARRGGASVYRRWLENSFSRPGKHFALAEDGNSGRTGFSLFSFTEGACVIELIAVAPHAANGGIGSQLVRAVEREAFRQGFADIRVGTQLRNTAAINFYHKAGFRQAGCHQVYHLWNPAGMPREGEYGEDPDRIHRQQAVPPV